LLFFCQSQLAGIIRVHPSNPWLVLFQPRPARGLLKMHMKPSLGNPSDWQTKSFSAYTSKRSDEERGAFKKRTIEMFR
jgi:hypothetical protein